uniref:Uncharacterized protein n=1 Tax=Anguilla anguilla TaxID=7936 RepID=A0A0E9PG81_ANGAN
MPRCVIHICSFVFFFYLECRAEDTVAQSIGGVIVFRSTICDTWL